MPVRLSFTVILCPFASYTRAAICPYRSDPRGILVIRMLWFTPMLIGPKSSEVTETAAAKMNPELRPISAVPATRVVTSCDFHIKKKANGMGTNAAVTHAVLAIDTFLLKFAYLVS
jgi:hypothetical protein